MVRRDLLLFLLNVLGNLILKLGGVGFLASRMGDLGFRGDKLWSLPQTRQRIAIVGPTVKCCTYLGFQSLLCSL